MEFEIDPHDPENPSYRQLADKLRRQIAAGIYGPREAIPSLTRLAQEAGVAVGTVQHAIQILRDEGLVYSVSGRGTFVTPK